MSAEGTDPLPLEDQLEEWLRIAGHATDSPAARSLRELFGKTQVFRGVSAESVQFFGTPLHENDGFRELVEQMSPGDKPLQDFTPPQFGALERIARALETIAKMPRP